MNDLELTSKEIAEIRLKYPPGTRLMLIIMEDSYAVPSGTRGTVDYGFAKYIRVYKAGVMQHKTDGVVVVIAEQILRPFTAACGSDLGDCHRENSFHLLRQCLFLLLLKV